MTELWGKLRLGGGLAMCLMFQENQGWGDYIRAAYKRKIYTNIAPFILKQKKMQQKRHRQTFLYQCARYDKQSAATT